MGRLLTLGVVCAIAVSSATGAEAAPACPVSTLSPITGRTSFNIGTTQLAVSLHSGATYVAVPEGRPGSAFVESGRIRVKLGWLSPSGGPRVTGRRLDAPAARLRVDMGVKSFVPGGGEFYPSHLYFPTIGCWRVTASNAKSNLTFTVRVVRQ